MNKEWLYIEKQLKERWNYKYLWYQKQNDQWDTYTHFIYKTKSWNELIKQIALLVEKEKLDKHQAFYYAINRWYNFWSAKVVEEIITAQPNVKAHPNPKNKTIDFYIHDIAFDHKTSVFPKGFGKSLAYAQQNKVALIEWLYKNQSNQQRLHFANRLFVIVHNSTKKHWHLKAEISLLNQAISKYVATFNPEKLVSIRFNQTQNTLSDIIWVSQ